MYWLLVLVAVILAEHKITDNNIVSKAHGKNWSSAKVSVIKLANDKVLKSCLSSLALACHVHDDHVLSVSYFHSLSAPTVDVIFIT